MEYKMKTDEIRIEYTLAYTSGYVSEVHTIPFSMLQQLLATAIADPSIDNVMFNTDSYLTPKNESSNVVNIRDYQ